MDSQKRNFIGDLIMSTTIGCAALFAFLIMCVVIGTTMTIILTFLKQPN